ncbi:hypothetical protein ACF0H5_008543 [Mactra antiquata]
MTAYKFTSSRQLRDALNNIEKVQKQNIDEYSWGHLNEKNLYKPPYHLTQAGGRLWKSSKNKKTKLKNEDLIPGLQTHKPKKQDSGTQMKDVLYEFSVGTMGSVPLPSPVKPATSPRRDRLNDFRKETPNISKVTEEPRPLTDDSTKSLYSQLDDGVLIEELANNEMVVNSPQMNSGYYAPKRLKPSDRDYDIMADLTQTLDTEGYLTTKHSFLPSFTSGVTKSDQFNKLRKFESNVLRKQDCREMKVLSGVKAVAHLERRLEEDLELMNLSGIGPNFHKLQVYSNNFEDLIDETPTFGYMLKCIKSEYDNYITKLLDSQTPQHSRLLRDQVQQMSARGTSRPQELQDAKKRVENLEEEAKTQLEENQKLRQLVLEEEEWLANAPEPGM